MTLIIVFLCLQIALMLLILPLPIVVRFRFSLSQERCYVIFGLLGLKIKLRLQNEKGKMVTIINGKPAKLNGKRIRLPKIFALFNGEKVVQSVECLGLIGGEDADSASRNFAALASGICTLFPDVATAFMYPDFENNRLDFEINIKAKLSIYQAIKTAI